jgi:ABC-type Na+ efflux pump permease subunit
VRARRIRAIVRKEMLDLRKNRAIVVSMAALPLLLVGIVLGTMAFLGGIDATLTTDEAQQWSRFVTPELAALGPRDGFLVALTDQWIFYLMLMPMALPIAISTHGVIGEEQLRALEPLLATPVTTAELIVGKTIAAAWIPIALCWGAYAAVAIGAAFLSSPVVLAHVLRPAWPIGMLTLAPLLAVASTLAGLSASSRFQDPRSAQGVSVVFVLPLMGVAVTIVIGKVFVSPLLMLGASGVLLAVCAALLRLAVRLFARETVLTRWR